MYWSEARERVAVERGEKRMGGSAKFESQMQSMYNYFCSRRGGGVLKCMGTPLP